MFSGVMRPQLVLSSMPTPAALRVGHDRGQVGVQEGLAHLVQLHRVERAQPARFLAAISSRIRKTFSFFMNPRRRPMMSSGHQVHLKLQALVISMKR